jgi:rhodanese-related sulfurtransferase
MAERKSIRPLAQELCLILVPAILAAFVVNGFSPAGISLVGPRSNEQGAIPARGTGNHSDSGEAVLDPQGAHRIHEAQAAVFVDARSEASFSEGRIPGAVSLPVTRFDEMAGDFWERYPLETEIVTYCSGPQCQDSHRLADLLREFGYSHVRTFIGGIAGWEQAGYPLTREAGEKKGGTGS